MKTRIHTKYLFVLLFFLGTSCVTTVNIPVRYQPEIKLTEANPKILFVNQFDPESLNLKNEKETNVYASGVEQVILGLQQTFNEDENIEFVNCEPSIKIIADSLYKNSSNPDYIKFLCKDNGASHLLELDNFTIFFDSNINEDEDDFDSDDDSNELKIREFTVVIDAGFKLYDAEGKLINNSVVQETRHHKSRLVLIQWIELTPSVKKAGKNVDIAAKSIGVKYRAKFYQNIVNSPRNYYAGKDFKEVKKFIMSKDWIKAREALLIMAETDNQDISQKKVAHNLGVVYEALGDFNSSDYWYNKSGNNMLNNFPAPRY